MNEEQIHLLEMLPKDYEPGVSRSWEEGVLEHVRRAGALVTCKTGKNRLQIYALSGENVIERVILLRKGREIPVSYLGPAESRIV